MFLIKSFLISSITYTFLAVNAIANDFPNSMSDVDPKSFCVKEPDEFDIDLEHVMIIVDRTTKLAEEQIEWISDNLFSSKFAKKFPPFTKFSLIFADNSSVQLQELQYSKCRPKTSKKSKKFEGDKYSSDENEMMVISKFNRFLEGNDTNIGFLNLKNIIGLTEKAENTFVLETFIRVLTDPSLDFSKDDYTKRTLIIASDLMQYSDNLDFYSWCKQRIQNQVKNDCGSFKSLMDSNRMVADYINNTKPSRNLENLEIKLMYLNFDETHRAIDASLLQLWADYFSHIGYQVPEDAQDWIERQLDFLDKYFTKLLLVIS